MMRGITIIFLLFISIYSNAQVERKSNAVYGGKQYLELTFNAIPSESVIAELKHLGITLTSYIGGTSYHAVLPMGFGNKELQSFGVSMVKHQVKKNTIQSIFAESKTKLAKDKETFDFAVAFPHKMDKDELIALLSKHGAKLIEIQAEGRICIIQSDIETAEKINDEAVVSFIDVSIEDDIESLNFEARITHGAEYLQNGLKGYNLTGEGIVIGVGDGGELGDHIDLNEFVINEADGTIASFGSHADHVSGIIGSRGNLNPRHKGMAPNCTIVTDKSNNITSNAEEFHSKYDMVLTNNSYGVSFNCDNSGAYNYSSFNLDRQLNEYPHLLHLFAAGNSGSNVCDDYPQGFKTVLKGYGASKNVITVGSIDDDQTIALMSSKGPVQDGRIKPEIVGVGVNIMSCGNTNNYFSSSGTSMATPAVTGSIALIYERYKQIHGSLPYGDLIKSLVCNSADDLGNYGPDYVYGFGLINPIRAIRDLDDEKYFVENVGHGEEQIHTIEVPAGLTELKVMNYWHDYQAAANPTVALINDLNIQVISPDGVLYNPWVLNPDPAHADDLPKRKVDNLNNIEQITIMNPKPGTYTIKVKGKNVPMGSQRYNLTYSFRSQGIELMFPNGTESMIPGDKNLISWMNEEVSESNYKLEFSLDGGSTWQLIQNNIDRKENSFLWEVPDEFTSNAKIRIGNSNHTAQNEIPFSIIKRPENFMVSAICEDYMKLMWTPIDEADSYVAYMYEKGEMVQVGETTESKIEIPYNYEMDKVYWFAIAAKKSNGVLSERSIAVPSTLDVSNPCPHEYDCKIISINGLQNGRAYTSTSLGEEENLRIALKNVGRDDITDFGVFLQVNEQEVIEETFESTLFSGMEMDYPFKTTFDLSKPHDYKINSWISLPNDDYQLNDSLIGGYVVTQLPNEPIEFPYLEDFQSKDVFIIHESALGLNDLYAWDYTNNGTELSALKLMMSTENKYLRLSNHEDVQNSSTMTLNLSALEKDDQATLSFKYLLSNMAINEGLVYLRGSDQDEWILIKELDYAVAWKTTEKIDLKKALLENDQAYSSSTQIKFDLFLAGSLNIDDVQLELREEPEEEPNVLAAGGEEPTIKLYPNPFEEELKISINSKFENQANFRLYDTGGKMIFETQKYLLEGANDFSFQLGDLLSSGIYFMSVSSNDEHTIHKITKL